MPQPNVWPRRQLRRTSLMALTRSSSCRDLGDDARPVSRRRLTEYSRRGVPGAFRTVAQPTPASIEAREHPHLRARARRRDAPPRYRRKSRRSRFFIKAAVSAKSAISSMKSWTLLPLASRAGSPFLQTVEIDLRQLQYRPHRLQRHASALVDAAEPRLALSEVGRPDQANLELVPMDPRGPLGRQSVVRKEIRYGGRHGFERGPEQMGQRHDRNLLIETAVVHARRWRRPRRDNS